METKKNAEPVTLFSNDTIRSSMTAQIISPKMP